MDGISPTLHLIVPVDVSPWNMLCHALLVVFHPYTIMKFVTSLLHCYLRSVLILRLNLIWNHSQESTSTSGQLIVNRALVLTWQLMMCWEEGFNVHFLMSVCSIHLLNQIWIPLLPLPIEDTRMINIDSMSNV